MQNFIKFLKLKFIDWTKEVKFIYFNFIIETGVSHYVASIEQK